MKTGCRICAVLLKSNTVVPRYVLEGGMQDWNYEWTNDYDITLELGCDKYPSKEHLEPLWDDNKEALMTYMEHVHMGIKGARKPFKYSKNVVTGYLKTRK